MVRTSRQRQPERNNLSYSLFIQVLNYVDHPDEDTFSCELIECSDQYLHHALITSVSHGDVNPLTPVSAAKMVGVLAIVQGAYLALAPSKSLKVYVVEEEITNPINVKILRRTGLLVLNMGVYVYGLIFKDYGIRASVAINSLMFVAETLSYLFNNESETIGPFKASDLSFLAVTGPHSICRVEQLRIPQPFIQSILCLYDQLWPP